MIKTGVRVPPPEEKECEWCGGAFLSLAHRPKRFCSRKCVGAHGHSKRKRGMRGKDNPNFNNGFCIHKGRAMITCRDGTVLWYSRALMAGHLKRLLRPDEIVHHINHDGTDDRIENLEIVTRSEHMKIHHAEILAAKGVFV